MITYSIALRSFTRSPNFSIYIHLSTIIFPTNFFLQFRNIERMTLFGEKNQIVTTANFDFDFQVSPKDIPKSCIKLNHEFHPAIIVTTSRYQPLPRPSYQFYHRESIDGSSNPARTESKLIAIYAPAHPVRSHRTMPSRKTIQHADYPWSIPAQFPNVLPELWPRARIRDSAYACPLLADLRATPSPC